MDERASFAAFIYENVTSIEDITSIQKGSVGFDAGDGSRGDTISYGNYSFIPLQDVNVFRIDGTWYTKTSSLLVNNIPFYSRSPISSGDKGGLSPLTLAMISNGHLKVEYAP